MRLVDHRGDDAAIVRAARVSYWAGTKTVNDDRGLIRYLLRHWHTTPLLEFKFHSRGPIGLLAAVDQAPSGERQRVQHSLLGGDRLDADDRGG